MKSWTRTLKDWLGDPLPSAVQPATGLQRDQDFAPTEPGIVERFAGYWRGHPVYRERAPRPIILRDPRAVRNEEIAAKQRASRGGDRLPITIIDGM